MKKMQLKRKMTTEHKCSHCQEIKSEEDFWITKRSNGSSRMRMCLACRKNYRNNSNDYYQEKIAEQNGLCAICGVNEVQNGQKFSIDHDHTTGKFRGLLCVRCNFGIGHFKDNANNLTKAVQYLHLHKP